MEFRSIWMSFRQRRCERRDRRRFVDGFATWLPSPLTESQISAVVSYAPDTLVVAGAGSGKTTLLLGRARYLVAAGRGQPDRILALAFNKSAAVELEERSKAAGVPLKTMTFHGYGNEVLNARGRLGGVAFSDDHILEKFFDDHVNESLRSDPNGRLVKFFSEMLVPFCDHSNFKSIEDYAAYARVIPRTFAKERVKSHGELIIANYLFRRGATYGYESLYKQAERGVWHRPDFTVDTPENKKIYVEYFGVDGQGNTAPYVDREKYNEEIEWKRTTHVQNDTTLVELTYQDLRDGVLVEKLEQRLSELGVPQAWRTNEELAEAANQIGYTTRFLKLCKAFLAHTRARRLDSRQVKFMSGADRRTSAFLDIFSEFLADYEAELIRLGLPDFSAMIHDASDMLINKSVTFPYDHVLVDEYQDISADRQRLLEAMKTANPRTEFLFVGDDWQSINRFAGADISIMRRASRLSLMKKTVRLVETHRFPQSLAEVSSKFIQKNPKQIKKTILSTNPSTATETLFIHTSTTEQAHTANLQSVIDFIGEENNGHSSLLVIARYNDNLPNHAQVKRLWRGPIEVRSIHGSKGSEADYVIIMDVVQDFRGFPSTIGDDPILNLVLPEPESYAYAEERRLFYVALTRARVACHVIAPLEQPSLFAAELVKEEIAIVVGPTEVEVHHCPVCRSGILTRSPRDDGTNCSNYPACVFRTPWCPHCNRKLHVTSTNPMEYACTNHPDEIFTTCRARNCGWGILVERQGRFGSFRACSNYMAIGCKGR